MSRVVYTAEAQLPLSRLVSPYWIARDLYRYRELISAYAKREFESVHRATYLGLVWSVLSPLIMLALFTFVFGHVFNGRFTQRADETPSEFALALFVGLSLFQCVGQTLGSAPGLVVSNSAYVKTLAFPLQVLSVATVVNVLFNLAIALALCFIAFFWMYGFIHLSSLALILHIACITLICLGLSWFLSALGVFVRDVAAVVPPLNVVLMFISSVFFPLSAVAKSARWILELNPLAVIIDQARGAFLHGQWPNWGALAIVFALSLAMAVIGYWFFMRAKPAFADVI